MITIKQSISSTSISNIKVLWSKQLSGSKQLDSSVLKLKTPKIIYNDNAKISNNKNSINSISDVLVEDVNSIIINRPDKKNKNYNKSVDTLDSRKNKIKPKKKLRTKIHINDDDDNLDTLYSGVNKEDRSLELSLMRPAKPAKKNTSLKSNFVSKTTKRNIIKSKTDPVSVKVKKSKPEVISLSNTISIEKLSDLLVIPAAEIIKFLFLQGISVTINQVIDEKIAAEVAQSYGIQIDDKNEDFLYNQNLQQAIPVKSLAANALLEFRAPIVTIFGHVDHGKTTLLNSLCQLKASINEAGGITQAIVAYEVPNTDSDRYEKIIFLDTPGHEAFSDMRIRGVQVTDIGILVVAADDGLKPQTKEAIEHLQTYKLPFIVAINKVDKPEANIAKVIEELAAFNILSQDLGGDTPIREVSALKNINIDLLLENIVNLADANELKANSEEPARGTILDAYLDKKQGPIAKILIQDGTLYKGDYFISSDCISKIRSIVGKNAVQVENAGPSSIVEISGLSSIPNSGSTFEVIEDEKLAKKKLSELQKTKDTNYKFNHKLNTRITFDGSNKLKDNLTVKKVNIILKTDKEGTIEAIITAFSRIPQEKVQINIVSVGVGEITESDINLAIISQSILLSFNTIIPLQSEILANKSKIIIADFSIIYDLIEYVEQLMLQLVEIDYAEQVIGNAIVENVFALSKGNVAGCIVISGKLKRNAYIRVTNKNELIYKGKLTSLKRIKEDVEEVNAGNECGILCDTFDSWHKKYEIEAYEKVELDKTLEKI